ncbi:MAG: hypothetical protein AAF242_20710, partial [Bacteroidota bacterium]
GQVQIYLVSGNNLTMMGSTIIGTAEGDRLGRSIAFSQDGSRIAIGLSGPGNSQRGGIRVFDFNGSNWQSFGGTLIGDSHGDQFGIFLDISADGTKLSAGAGGQSNYDLGYLINFEQQGNQWVARGDTIYDSTVGTSFGEGIAVSASGDIVAVGAGTSDENGNNSGRVQVYQWENEQWTPLGNVIYGIHSQVSLGRAIDLSDDGLTLALSSAGEIYDDGQGVARVYQLIGNTWTQIGQDLKDPGSQYPSYGSSITLNAAGNRLAIGKRGADEVAPWAGRVDIFDLVNGSWVLYDQSLYGSMEDEWFGHFVEFDDSGDRLLVSAYGASYLPGDILLFEDNPLPVSTLSPGLSEVSIISQKGLIEIHVPTPLLQDQVDVRIVDPLGRLLYWERQRIMDSWFIPHRWQGIVYVEIQIGQQKVTKGIWVSSE